MDFNNLINQFMGGASSSDESKASGINVGSLATGAAVGGAATYLMSSNTGKHLGRKAMRVGRSVAGIGGLALIGGIAYKAYSSYKNGRDVNDKEDIDSSLSEDSIASSGLVILQTMIAAANADGIIDKEEQDKIFSQMDKENLSKEEQQFLMSEINNPLSCDVLAHRCTSDKMAVEVYAAALMAIEVDTIQEQRFIFDLRKALKLDNSLVEEIEKQLEPSLD